jgi:hypothetical protein
VIAMPNWQFHNAQNPTGFAAYGSEDEARAYLRRLNWAKVTDLWTMRQVAGKRRGISLGALLAEHGDAPAIDAAEDLDHLTHVERAQRALSMEENQ